MSGVVHEHKPGEGAENGVRATAIFLFNFDTRELEGLFVATAPPGLNLVEDAWKLSWRGGRKCTGSPFPAQVLVRRLDSSPAGPVMAAKEDRFSTGPLRKPVVDALIKKLKADPTELGGTASPRGSPTLGAQVPPRSASKGKGLALPKPKPQRGSGTQGASDKVAGGGVRSPPESPRGRNRGQDDSSRVDEAEEEEGGESAWGEEQGKQGQATWGGHVPIWGGQKPAVWGAPEPKPEPAKGVAEKPPNQRPTTKQQEQQHSATRTASSSATTEKVWDFQPGPGPEPQPEPQHESSALAN